MTKSKYDEKDILIKTIMESYILEQPSLSHNERLKKLDSLCDMETEALRYLAGLRKIKNIPQFIEM